MTERRWVRGRSSISPSSSATASTTNTASPPSSTTYPTPGSPTPTRVWTRSVCAWATVS